MAPHRIFLVGLALALAVSNLYGAPRPALPSPAKKRHGRPGSRVITGGLYSRYAQWMKRWNVVLAPPMAPRIRKVDLFGKKFDLAALRGKVVIVGFIDRKNRNEAMTWLERQPVFYLGRKDLVYVNVIYPGGVFFLIPRGEAVARIRKEVAAARRSVAEGLTPADRRRFEATKIHWVVDWKRRILKRFGAFRGRVNVFVLGRRGRISEVLRRLDDTTTLRLRLAVRHLLEQSPETKKAGKPGISPREESRKGPVKPRAKGSGL